MLPVHVNGGFPYFQIGGKSLISITNWNQLFTFGNILVVSYGIGCGRENIPGIYANVSHYMNWINKNLNE